MQEVRDFCSTPDGPAQRPDVGSYRDRRDRDDQVIELMIGRSLDVIFPAKPRRGGTPRRGRRRPWRCRGLLDRTACARSRFDLWPGEILGVGGLQGMGQRELFLGLFGATEPSAGDVARERHGRSTLRSPADAVDPRIGISLVPEDRKTEGLFLELDGQENVVASLASALHPERPDRRAGARHATSLAALAARRGRRAGALDSRSSSSAAATSRRSRSPSGCSPAAASCSSTTRPAASTSAPRPRSTA